MKKLIGLVMLFLCCGVSMRGVAEDGSKPEHPFRLRFLAYDIDSRRTPESMNFQIQLLDVKRPSEFCKLKDRISGTNFRLEKFEYKEGPDGKPGEEEDISEVTLVDISSGKRLVIVIDKSKDISEAK